LTIPIRDIKGRFGVTREVIEASNKGLKGAAAPALTREMEGLTEDIERQLNRQLFGFGSGTLATITTGANSATQTLSNPGGVSGTVNTARFVKPGMYVAITDSTGATIRDVQQVTASSNSSSNMTLANAYRKIHNQWIDVSGVKVDTFFCHPSLEREYYKLTQADRRYQGADLNNPDAGVDMNAKPMFGHIAEWVADKDGPYGTLIAVASDNLFVIYLNEGSWDSFGMDGDAPELLRFVPDQTSYEGVYYMLLNAYSDRGNAHFRADGCSVTVDSGVVAD
jgi:hypothetical protein